MPYKHTIARDKQFLAIIHKLIDGSELDAIDSKFLNEQEERVKSWEASHQA